jgi:cobalamin biosynthesis protein CobT
MSDDSAASPESTPKAPEEGAPRVRRISNPRIKKPTKVAKAEVEASAASEAAAPEAAAEVVAPKAAKFPEFFDEPERQQEEPASKGDWPEPEAASSGASQNSENPKRKRRRKKGKGGGSQNPQNQAEPENNGGEAPEAQAPANHGHQAQSSQQPQQQRPPQGPRPNKLDTELLAKFAWKIYLSEVSEEGVALVGDNDAKELARRCFRLAEIFMEEQSRRR